MTAAGPDVPAAITARLFLVLETCARSGRALSLSELADATGLAKSTLHRICAQLAELGALERAPGGFQIGAKLFALGSLNPELRRLRLLSMPYLHDLVSHSGCVANMAVLSERRALLVEEVFGLRPHMPKLLGATLPLHATALGKALLGGQPPARAKALISGLVLRRYTPNTLVRKDALRREVAEIAAGGVAVSREEWRLGTSAVAAPVIVNGEALAALALIDVAGERGVQRMRPVVRSAARDLAAVLAGRDGAGEHAPGAAAAPSRDAR